MSSKRTNGRGVIRYKSYMFTEKDPVIDLLRTAVSDSKMGYAEISADSNVSYSTLHNWFHGRTRRPQFATVAAVLCALPDGRSSVIDFRGGKPRLRKG